MTLPDLGVPPVTPATVGVPPSDVPCAAGDRCVELLGAAGDAAGSLALPDVGVPPVTLPCRDAAGRRGPAGARPEPVVRVGAVPSVTLPDVGVPSVTLPSVTLPDVGVPPVLPEPVVPSVAVPSVTLPDVGVPPVVPELVGSRR